MEACDVCLTDKRKILSADDVLWAFRSLGFDEYSRVLSVFLERYREAVKKDASNQFTTPTNH
jgi:nuclear transcription Y subunit beta